MHSKNNSQTCANLSVNGGTTPPSTPTITNPSATNITKTNAYLSATVNKTAGTTVSTCGIYLGTASSNMTKRNTETVGSAANNHNSGTSFNIYYDLNDELNITLSAGTTYYYKFYCTVGSTTYTSDTKSFTTAADTVTITNPGASSITQTDAYISATVNKTASTTVSTCGIYLGTSASNMTKRNTETVGSAANNHNSGKSFNIFYDLTDELNIVLTPGTTYYYKFYCTVGSSNYYSATASFTTTACSHSWGSGTVTTAATCTAAGVRTYTCSKCGSTKTESIAALGHNYSSVVTAPTCTEAGYTTHTCSRCGSSYTDTPVAALGHNYVDGVCTVCGATGSPNLVGGTCGNNLTWVLDTATGELAISGTGAMTSAPWHSYYDIITSVSLSDGVTSISNSAFTGCSELTSITIPDSVTSIGEEAFYMCTQLASVSLGSGLTVIGYSAFDYCIGLTSITIPDSVTIINGNAFFECSGLISVTIGEGVRYIGSDAFSDCTALTTVTIGSGVETIEDAAFSCCNALTDVYYTGSRSDWNAIDIGDRDNENDCLTGATIHYNYVRPCDHHWLAADPSDTAHYCAPTCDDDGWYDEICSVCGDVGNRCILNALGHDWAAGTPVAASCVTYGYTIYTCSRCGQTDEADIVEALGHNFVDGECTRCGASAVKINSAHPVLDKDVNLTYVVSITEEAEEPHMVFTYQGKSTTVTDYTVNEIGQYCFTFTHINPQCLGDKITAVLYATLDDETVTDIVANYSVKQYCVNMLNNTNDLPLMTLLSDLLTYGAAAQQYTNYKTSSLMTDGLDLTPSEFTAISGKNVSFTGTADAAIDWVSAGLILGNQVTMRFTFFAESIEGLAISVSINGREELFSEADFTALGSGKYCVDFCGIEANEFDDAVTATFLSDDEAVGRTISYSVNTYVCSTQNSENASLQALVRALYNYGASASGFALAN